VLLASKQVNSLVKSVVDKFGSETIKINILANNARVAFDMNLIRIIPASPYYRLLDSIIFNGPY
jgi:NAD(P)-dependent dehydrogenase (short-subunit alcohol dehydrogenase family)